MMNVYSAYLEFRHDYAPLIACLFSFLILTLLTFNIINTAKALRWTKMSLIAAFILSIDVYPYQVILLPSNIIYPVTLVMFILQNRGLLKRDSINMALFFSHFVYMIFALACLSSRGNTWGDGSASFGIFMVFNSLIILIYLIPRIERKIWIIIAKVGVGVLGFIAVYFTSKGFNYPELNWEGVSFRTRIAVIVCVFSVMEGIFVMRNNFKLFLTTKNNKGRVLE